MPTTLALGVPVALTLAKARFAKLRRAHPRAAGFPAAGTLTPVMLDSETWSDGTLWDITLSYGRVLDTAAPLILVTTYYAGAGDLPPLAQEIAARQRRDAAIDRRDWADTEDGSRHPQGESAGADSQGTTGEWYIDAFGTRQTVSGIADRQYVALQLGYGDQIVRVVGRHLPPELPPLAIIEDLEPYFRGYRDFQRQLLTWKPAGSAAGRTRTG